MSSMPTKIADGGRDQQAHQHGESAAEDVHRRERLVHVDLGGDAEVVVVQPLPGPDDRHAAVVAIAVPVVSAAGPAPPRGPCRVSGWSPRRSRRPLTGDHVDAGVAQLHVQNGPAVGAIDQQADLLQLVVKPALAEEHSAAVEGIGFSRIPAGPPGEFRVNSSSGPNPQAQRGDRLPCPSRIGAAAYMHGRLARSSPCSSAAAAG